MYRALRTPDERFADLPDFPFAAVYISDLRGCGGLRKHYIDEGPRNSSHLYLCLHVSPP